MPTVLDETPSAVAASRAVAEPGISSILNVNRDIHHSIKDLLQGILAE